MSLPGSVLLLVLWLALPSSVSAAMGDCSQPVSNGTSPSASDCLFILRTAVGTNTCTPPCICDTNGVGGTTASDALVCLKKAVGQPGISLNCQCPTTSTSSSTTTSSTTTTTPPAAHLSGVLAKTTGRFNFNMQIGLPGADAACNTAFAGTHACTFSELQAAETAGELDGLKDPGNNSVTSFWAIDSAHVDTKQCHQTIAWDYQTAHTGHFAERAALDNATGDLGPAADAVCSNQSWVGCCK